MDSKWRIFLDAQREEGAQKVLGRIVEALTVDTEIASVAPYPKGGYLALLSQQHPGHIPWAEVVFDLISECQLLGTGWQLSGRIEESANLLLSTAGGGNFTVPGVTMVECELIRKPAS